jgi:D-glycero-beta-D-manno-heptose 1-phosphate adenylyltransferase
MDKTEFIKSKILSGIHLDRMIAFWKFRNYKTVFTNGCFDILHLGHADYLARASDLGDILVVGINTDRSVMALKGDPRPLQDENSRTFLIASFMFVSAVVLFDQDTPLELIRKIQPDILVKGSDYNPEDIVGYDVVTGKGGKVISLDLVEGYSTTAIMNKLSG